MDLCCSYLTERSQRLICGTGHIYTFYDPGSGHSRFLGSTFTADINAREDRSGPIFLRQRYIETRRAIFKLDLALPEQFAGGVMRSMETDPLVSSSFIDWFHHNIMTFNLREK